MCNKYFNKSNKFHLIGIGGSGMNGIAEILLNMGLEVYGSDIQNSPVLNHLKKLGAKIYIGQAKENIDKNIDVVIYSSAVKTNNPELIRAKELRIPAIKRAVMLAELSRTKNSIAIAGTHGKTSTSTMMGKILTTAGKDPTIIVGGIIKNTKTGAIWGQSEYLVMEADEYDKSFLKLTPIYEIVTNIEEDHLECYGDFENIKKAFIEFINRVPFYGKAALCIDDNGVQEILTDIESPVLTFSIKMKSADYYITNLKYINGTSSFDINHQGKNLGNIVLSVPGKHNVKNALGAITIALDLDIEFEQIALALKDFYNVKRRFEICYVKNNIEFIDDYAHHPTEIKTTLETAKKVTKNRVIALFQPHLYSRVINFAKEFGKAFKAANIVYITKIYGARELPIDGVTSELLIDRIAENSNVEVRYIEEITELPQAVAIEVQKGDVVISLGAGDINKYLKMIPELI